MHLRPLVLAAPVATAVLLSTTLAGAADAPAAAERFAWDAPSECPGGDAFAAAVRARGRTLAAGSPARLRLTVTRDGGDYVGTMRLEGETAPREVRGNVCSEVVDALAIAAVSALGPEPKAAPPSSPPVAPVEAPSTIISNPPRELPVTAGTLRFQRDLTLSIEAGVMSGLVSGTVLPRYDFVLGVDNVMLTPEGRGYRLGPMVRVRASLLGEVTRHYGFGSTHIGGFAVGLELCGPLYYDRQGLTVLICPQFAGGQLGLRTTNAGADTQSKQAGFGTGGLSFEAGYRFGALRVNAEVGGGTVIGDITAEAPDGTQLSKSSVWSAHAMVGLGVTF